MTFPSNRPRLALAAALVCLAPLTSIALVAGCSSGNGAGPGSGDTSDSGSGSGKDSSADAGGKKDSGPTAKDSGTPPVDTGTPFDAGTFDAVAPTDDGGRRAIPPEDLTRKAICYSGYRTNEDPEATPPTYPTEAEVTQDLNLLHQGGWSFLRLFDCSPHASVTLKAIKDSGLDFKVMQGVWVFGPAKTFDSQTQAEIQRCLALEAQYSDIIVAYSVGNETLDAWSSVLTPAADLAQYVAEVRGQVTKPVTTDDFPTVFDQAGGNLPSGPFYSYSDDILVLKAVDFLAVHVYPFLDAPYTTWNYQQTAVDAGPDRAVAMMTAAQGYNESMMADLNQYLQQQNISIPVVLGESGWKTLPDQGSYEVSLAHQVNQQMYYSTENAWVTGAAKDANSPLLVFYFEAFDEPWKGGDDNWGLFDVNRYAKYSIWDIFPNQKPPGAPAYTAADAVYYKAGDPLNAP